MLLFLAGTFMIRLGKSVEFTSWYLQHKKNRLLTTVTTSIKCAHNHASIVVRAVMLSDSVIYTKKLPPSYSHACPSQTPRQA